jgi:hypothetical protein
VTQKPQINKAVVHFAIAFISILIKLRRPTLKYLVPIFRNGIRTGGRFRLLMHKIKKFNDRI